MKNRRFSTNNILLYLGNDTRYGHNKGRRIGTYAIYRLVIFPMILNDNPDFKVTPIFDAE